LIPFLLIGFLYSIDFRESDRWYRIIDLGSSFPVATAPALTHFPTTPGSASWAIFKTPRRIKKLPVQYLIILKFNQNVLHIDIPLIGIGLLDSTCQ
jgi:hypothetical protein